MFATFATRARKWWDIFMNIMVAKSIRFLTLYILFIQLRQKTWQAAPLRKILLAEVIKIMEICISIFFIFANNNHIVEGENSASAAIERPTVSYAEAIPTGEGNIGIT